MKVAGYVRVSTDKQLDGLGLEVQEQAIRKWCRANKHRLVTVYRDEGISGSNGLDTRVGLHEALVAIEDGKASGLVVAKLDRLARHLVTQETTLAAIWKMGGSVFSVDIGEVSKDDPDDPMLTAFRQMIGVFAQLERGMIRTRLRAGKNRKREKKGYVHGGPPLGFRAEGKELVPDVDEQKTVKRIRQLKGQGKSLREIKAVLEAEGHKTKTGKTTWHPETLRQILARKP